MNFVEVMKLALEALENSSPDSYPESAGVFYDAKDALRTAIEQAEKRWSEFNETTKRNIEHADWYLSTHPAPVDHLLAEITKLWGVIHDQQQQLAEASKQRPAGIVQVLPLGEGHKPMHWADWTDSDNPPPEGTPLYTTPPAAPENGGH